MLDKKRIKEDINEHPWRCSLFYPLIFFSLAYFFSWVFNTYIYLWSLLIIFFWIFFCRKVSKRKIPFIIGIVICIIMSLFFIGKSAYNAQVHGSKIAVTKDSYSNTITTIKTEIAKCKSGEAKFMGSNEDCPVTGAKVINGVLVLFQEYPKNPFDDFKKAIRNSDRNEDDKDLGYISVSNLGSTIFIKTCFNTPCKKEENRKQSTVSVE